MKLTTKSVGCSMQAHQVIANHGCKAEEYMSNGKRVLVIVNTRTGARIQNNINEKSFDDICKRLGWL